MRRLLLPRRPIGARRPAQPIAAAARSRRALWRRPLTLIFRERRNPVRTPVPAVRSAEGRAIAIAPRLQLVLQLWTSLGEQHWHLAPPAPAAAAAPPAGAVFRSRHLHFHRASESRQAGRPAPRLLPAPAQAPSAERLRSAGLRIRRGAAPSGPGAGPARPMQILSSATRPGAARLYRQSRRADLADPASSSAGVRARARVPAPPLDLPDAPSVRRVAPPAAADTFPSVFAGSRSAQLARARGADLVVARSPDRPRALRAGEARRSRPLALLELAGVQAGRAERSSATGPGGPARRRPEPPPPLDYRRPAPPAAAGAAQPAPTPAPPPQAPAIDLDALSRDVISRIEKRLRIERERHGRV